MADSAGLSVINDSGTLLIDERYKNAALLSSVPGGSMQTVSDNGDIFAFGEPAGLANNSAALIVYTASGAVAFDSRQQYSRVVEVRSGTTGSVPSGLGTFTYPSGRKYAVMVLQRAFSSFPVQSGGSPGAYYWKWTFYSLQTKVVGNQVTISQLIENEPENFGPGGLPAARGSNNWKVAIIDVTGYPASSAYAAISNVVISPSPVAGSINSSSPALVTSSSVSVAWSGGNAAAKVTWAKVSGTDFTSPGSNPGAFSATIAAGGSFSAVYRATVSDGTSSATADVTVTLQNNYATSTLPAPTASISPSSVIGGNPFTITWNAVARTPTANGTVNYTLWYRYNGGAWSSLNKGTSTSHAGTTDSTMYGRNYEFYVVASDTGGSSGNSNTVALAVTAPSVLATPAPSAPSTAKVGDWFNVTWPAVTRTPTANGTVTYKIRITDNGTLLPSEYTPTPGASGLYLSANVTSANVGHTYGYSVQATDSGGSSGWSSEIFVACTN